MQQKLSVLRISSVTHRLRAGKPIMDQKLDSQEKMIILVHMGDGKRVM